MWKPMADALRKNKKEIGWADILAMAQDPQGWGSVGNPQWGEFRFAHTHPEYSNSGLIAVLAAISAACGKTEEVQASDLKNPKVAQFLEGLEKSVVHYGASTGFFADKMAANGMPYLSAAVLYENLVIEANSKQKLEEPLVAIYPKEGTFWCDHPVAIVKRDWVTEEHQKACAEYVEFLRAKPQQQKALALGFRPADESIKLEAPFTAENGVDPAEPNILPLPSASVMSGMLELWRKHKKPSRVVLVIDVSGSMKAEHKMEHAKRAAQELVALLGERDTLSVLAFDDQLRWLEKEGMRMDQAGRQRMHATLGALAPLGRTALYDAVDAAHTYVQSTPKPGTISAIIVLTDGEDTDSKQKLEPLKKKIKVDYEKTNTRIFTIAYGRDAKPNILKQIADETQAKEYIGDPQTILQVLRDIATFF